jgi:hypothetical protein
MEKLCNQERKFLSSGEIYLSKKDNNYPQRTKYFPGGKKVPLTGFELATVEKSV